MYTWGLNCSVTSIIIELFSWWKMHYYQFRFICAGFSGLREQLCVWTHAPRGPPRLFTASKCRFLFVSFTAVLSVSHWIIFSIIHLNLSGGAGVEDAGVNAEVGSFDVWIVHSCSLCSFEFTSTMVFLIMQLQLFSDTLLNDDMHLQLFESERETLQVWLCQIN